MSKEKNEWISNKIKILENENSGRSHSQNIAIAFSMYEKSHKKQEGGLENYYQTGGWYDNNPTYFQTNQPPYPAPNTQYLQGDNNLDGIVDYRDNIDKFGNPVETQQAINPYIYQQQPWIDMSFDTGVSNPAALQYGLYNFGQGNTTQGILGTTKAGLGFLREGLSAYASGKANKYAIDQYQQKQYQDWRQPRYGQQGGYIPVEQSDVAPINKATGLNLNLQGAQQLFARGRTTDAPQKPISHIQPVSIPEQRGQLPAGDYYKVYYTDPSRAKIENEDYEYVNSSGYKALQRMSNYTDYMNRLRADIGAPRPKQNSVTSIYQEGGDLNYVQNWYQNRNQILDAQGNTVTLPKFDLMYNPNISFTDYGNTSTAGEFNPQTKQITLANDYNQRGVSGIAGHEINHYIQDQLPSGAYTDYIYNPVINSMGLQNEELYQTGTPEQRYLREPEEVHSRLMQFRQLNNYQPNQIITPETIQNSQGKEQFKLNMFNDEQLSNLLNQTVDAGQDTSIYFAKKGGRMYQEGGEAVASAEDIIQAYSQISGQNPQDILAQLQQMSPEEQQNALNQMMQAIQQAQNQQPTMQEGGEITGAEALTGEYAVAVPEGNKSTIEVEGGEWIKDNKTGEVQQVVGKKHSQGGVDLDLEDAKIVSDYTKIGAENAKHFSKTYDIKVSAKDTFATVLDKVNAKSGLQKLIDEEVSISEQMEKVLTKPDADPSSQEINAQFLTDKMQEVQTKQEPLKLYRSEVFDDVFKRQEAVPKKGDGTEILDKNGNPIKAQEGLEINPLLAQIAEQYNIDPQRVQELLVSNQTYYQQGGNTGYSPKDRQERFKIWAENMKAYGYTGDTNVAVKDLDKEAGKLQEWVVDNKPELVLEYFQTQPMTAKGIDIIKAKYPEAFKQANISANKQSAQYSPEEKDALKGALGEKLDSSFWLDQFKDKKYDWRGILTTGVPDVPTVAGTFNDIKASALPSYYQPEQEQPTVQEIAEQVKEKVPRSGTNVNLPFESLYLPPSSIQPVFLAQVQAPKVDFIKATAEPNLVEIERQRLNTQDQLGFLPSSQRAAVIASNLAQGQSATNQAISQVEIANQQAENTARNQQASLDFKADLANQQYRQDYEAKVFQGMNAYEQALQNYYNKAYNEPGMLAELNRNKRLAYNALNENYKIGTNGVQFVDSGQPIITAPATPTGNYVNINQLSPAMQKQIEKALKKT